MGEWGMEKILIISHRGISSLQGLYICFRHSYTNASLPYVGFFGPVPTVGSHHAVPDLCIHIIKGRTLLFPWRPRICGGRDSVMLDRTTVIKMHGARGLSLLWCDCPFDYAVRLPLHDADTLWQQGWRRRFSSLLCPTLYFNLTSRFGVVLVGLL